MAIAALQRQTREQQEKILHLESQLRYILSNLSGTAALVSLYLLTFRATAEVRERFDSDRARFEHRYSDMMARLASALCVDASLASSENLCARVSNLPIHMSFVAQNLYAWLIM